jgi:hypothetical protein
VALVVIIELLRVHRDLEICSSGNITLNAKWPLKIKPIFHYYVARTTYFCVTEFALNSDANTFYRSKQEDHLNESYSPFISRMM